jgi:hypothetical protein
MTLSELIAGLAALSKAEKAEIVERLAQEIGDGGAACVVRTRIAVWVLEGYRRLGWTEAKILANYPTEAGESSTSPSFISAKTWWCRISRVGGVNGCR